MSNIKNVNSLLGKSLFACRPSVERSKVKFSHSWVPLEMIKFCFLLTDTWMRQMLGSTRGFTMLSLKCLGLRPRAFLVKAVLQIILNNLEYSVTSCLSVNFLSQWICCSKFIRHVPLYSFSFFCSFVNLWVIQKAENSN